MIRDAVIHIVNEQPLLADLFVLPSPGDAGLLCSNLRTLNGQRPVFADRIESTFFFPLTHIRFVEISPDAAQSDDRAHWSVEDRAPGVEDAGVPVPEPDLEIDEELLRRVREL